MFIAGLYLCSYSASYLDPDEAHIPKGALEGIRAPNH